ncbi:MAG: hypothetical protein S4CHLAM2_15960 [Chlamydiales bacterium]|nr:hypothetical protein [Chlamydiales bacterium]
MRHVLFFFGCWVMTASLFGGDGCGVHDLQLGFNYTHVCFEPDGDAEFEGDLGGVQVLYEYRPWSGLYAGAKVAWREGNVERDFSYVDVQERLGYRFAFCCGSIEWIPFAGVGYRHVGQGTTCPQGCGVDFRYNTFYVPIGLISHHCICRSLSVGLNLTWMPQFYPTVRITPLNGARWILEETYDNFLVEFPVTWCVQLGCWDWRFVLKPFYERWNNGQTTAKKSDGTPLGLPGIRYDFWGIDVNLLYVF